MWPNVSETTLRRCPAAKCASHGQRCQVPDGDDAPLALGGWSCKDLSKLSVGYNKGNHARILEEQKGTSGTTFRDLLHFLDVKGIKIFIGENVEDLTSMESQNRSYVEQATCHARLFFVAVVLAALQRQPFELGQQQMGFVGSSRTVA